MVVWKVAGRAYSAGAQPCPRGRFCEAAAPTGGAPAYLMSFVEEQTEIGKDHPGNFCQPLLFLNFLSRYQAGSEEMPVDMCPGPQPWRASPRLDWAPPLALALSLRSTGQGEAGQARRSLSQRPGTDTGMG